MRSSVFQLGRSSGESNKLLRQRAGLLESIQPVSGYGRQVGEPGPHRPSELFVVSEPFEQPAAPEVQISEPFVGILRSRMDSEHLLEQSARFANIAHVPNRVGFPNERLAAIAVEPMLARRANFALASFLLGLLTPLPIHDGEIASKNVDIVN